MKNKANVFMVVAGIIGMAFAARAFGMGQYLDATVMAILSGALIFSFRK